ncbi:hypothetical protein Leryth_019935 [Lithospermum erythrorhizon]|nr:hypothetical protein Leryth_019935 [Lithospermum erythrorhizon]
MGQWHSKAGPELTETVRSALEILRIFLEVQAHPREAELWRIDWAADKTPATSQPKGKRDPSSPKLSKKFIQKLEKTKVAASTGMKKVKEGASHGVNRIKVKMNKEKLISQK